MLGTPYCPHATKAMLLGCGELGKEVCIELQRYGIEVVAVDRYENAPAMQVAHHYHVINMLDGDELEKIVELKPKTIEDLKKAIKLFQVVLLL